MKRRLLAGFALFTFGFVVAMAQGSGDIVKYISENKLYRNGNDVTITHLDLEWPVALEGNGMSDLQSELCKKLLGVEASDMQTGWRKFHASLGTEIKNMPDSVRRHYLDVKLVELWYVKGQYVSFYLKREQTEEDGSTSGGTKEYITFDLFNNVNLQPKNVFPVVS